MTKTVEEVRRELFEARMDALDKNPGLWLDGGYSNVYGQCAWIGFNAALDAVEIQLPEPHYTNGGDCVIDYDETLDAIEQAGLGLRVK